MQPQQTTEIVSVLAHSVHYGIVTAGLLGLLALLAPQWLPGGRVPARAGPADSHAQRVASLRSSIARGSLADVLVVAVPTSTTAAAPVRPPDPPTRPLALPLALVSSAAAAGIHAAVGPTHFEEGLLIGSFFAVAALAQLGWAAAVLVAPSRRLLLIGAVGNLAIVALWLATRTVGLPFGIDDRARGQRPLGPRGHRLGTDHRRPLPRAPGPSRTPRTRPRSAGLAPRRAAVATGLPDRDRAPAVRRSGGGMNIDSWMVGMVCNAIISLAYLLIVFAVAVPLARSGQLRKNPLGAATAAIFLTCSVHHGAHAIHMLLPAFGIYDEQGLAMRVGWGWPLALWDVAGAVVGVYYWSLRRNYPGMLHGAQLFADLRQREQQALELNDSVLQGLVVAKMALDLDDVEKARGALTHSISSASAIITDLLGSDHFDAVLLRSNAATGKKPPGHDSSPPPTTPAE